MNNEQRRQEKNLHLMEDTYDNFINSEEERFNMEDGFWEILNKILDNDEKLDILNENCAVEQLIAIKRKLVKR